MDIIQSILGFWLESWSKVGKRLAVLNLHIEVMLSVSFSVDFFLFEGFGVCF